MAKKIEKSVRNTKVAKVLKRQRLVEKIEEQQYSIVVFSNETKEMKAHIDIFLTLEEKGLEDRAIFLRRDSDLSSNVLQKIENTILRPKYIKCNIIDKPLIFFGSLESFKMVLKEYPKLTFKKFLDINKDRQDALNFLRMKNEVVLTNDHIW